MWCATAAANGQLSGRFFGSIDRDCQGFTMDRFMFHDEALEKAHWKDSLHAVVFTDRLAQRQPFIV